MAEIAAVALWVVNHSRFYESLPRNDRLPVLLLEHPVLMRSPYMENVVRSGWDG